MRNAWYLSLKENLYVFHLPLPVRWSRQCHIQTGRSSAQQWRLWRSRSQWSVEMQHRIGKHQQPAVAHDLIKLPFDLLQVPQASSSSLLSIPAYPELPASRCYSREIVRATQHFPYHVAILKGLGKVDEGKKSSLKVQNRKWELELQLTKGDCQDRNRDVSGRSQVQNQYQSDGKNSWPWHKNISMFPEEASSSLLISTSVSL